MMHPSGVWLMERWSQDDFQRAVEALCESVSPAPDWDTLGARLTRYLRWDYEYSHDDEMNRRHGLPRVWSPDKN